MTRVASASTAPGRTRRPRSARKSGSRRSLQQQSAVGVRIRAHPALAFGRELGELGTQPAAARRRAPPVDSSASSPRECGRARGCRASRPAAPDASARSPRSSCRRLPSVRSSPWASAARSSASAAARSTPLARAACWMRRISSTIASSVAAIAWCMRLGIVAFDEVRAVAVAAQQRLELLVADARQHRRARDLVAVQMEDRQHGAVGDRIEELVRVPARRERTGLGLAVADDAGDEQIGIVERGAVGVRERSSRARRPRESSRASPARRGSGCRRETRTA